MRPCLCAKIHIKCIWILFRHGSRLKESHSIYVWITLSPRTKHHAWSIWTMGAQSATRWGAHPPMRKKLDRNNSLHSVCKYRISKWCLSHIKQLLVKVTGPKCFTQGTEYSWPRCHETMTAPEDTVSKGHWEMLLTTEKRTEKSWKWAMTFLIIDWSCKAEGENILVNKTCMFKKAALFHNSPPQPL